MTRRPRRRRLGPQQTRREFLRTALTASGALAGHRLLGPRSARAADPPPPARRLGDLAASALQADVCIIGSGPAGTILGLTLASRGISTLLVESGPAADAPRAKQVESLDAYTAPGEFNYPLASTRFRGAGGTSNLWTGTCPRFYPIDFEPNAYTPKGAPWPIRYAELEPFYLRAEEELLVRGTSDAPYTPPRTAPYPRQLTESLPNLERLRQGAQSPIALYVMPWSDWHGQPVRIASTHLPRFSALPHATLACGATATRILCDDAGRIEGVRFESFDAPPRTVQARAYVIACGGVESARLLLLSRCARFPDGLGNQGDQVGRNFMEHPSVVIGKATVRGWWNPWSLRERAFSGQFVAAAKAQGLGGLRLRWLATRSGIGLDPSAPLQSVGKGYRALRELDVDLKAQTEMEPSPLNRVTLTDRVVDGFGNPGAALALAFTDNDRRTTSYSADIVHRQLLAAGGENIAVEVIKPFWDHHHMGTCRMGDDPATSVVDRNLCVHGVDNLYVAGSAPFVTSGVSNPTLTITALSLRLADHLTAQLKPT